MAFLIRMDKGMPRRNQTGCRTLLLSEKKTAGLMLSLWYFFCMVFAVQDVKMTCISVEFVLNYGQTGGLGWLEETIISP